MVQDNFVVVHTQEKAGELSRCPCFTNSAIKPPAVDKQDHTETIRPTCKALGAVLPSQSLRQYQRCGGTHIKYDI